MTGGRPWLSPGRPPWIPPPRAGAVARFLGRVALAAAVFVSRREGDL